MISDCESPIISHLSFDIFHLPFQPSQPFGMGDLSPRTRSVTSPPSKRISKRISSNGKGKMSNNKRKMVRRLLLTAYCLPFSLSVRPTLSKQRQLVRERNSADAQ